MSLIERLIEEYGHTNQLIVSPRLSSQLLGAYVLLVALYYHLEQAQIQGYPDRSILPWLRHESNPDNSKKEVIVSKIFPYLMADSIDSFERGFCCDKAIIDPTQQFRMTFRTSTRSCFSCPFDVVDQRQKRRTWWFSHDFWGGLNLSHLMWKP